MERRHSDEFRLEGQYSFVSLPWRNSKSNRFIGTTRFHEVVHRFIRKIPPKTGGKRLIMDSECALALAFFKKLTIGIQRFRAKLLVYDASTKFFV